MTASLLAVGCRKPIRNVHFQYEIIVNLCIVIGVVADGFGVYKIRLETQHAIFNRNCRYLWENIVHLSNLAFTHTQQHTHIAHRHAQAHPVVCANANKNWNFIQMKKYCSMARSVYSWRVQTDATISSSLSPTSVSISSISRRRHRASSALKLSSEIITFEFNFDSSFFFGDFEGILF